MSFEAQVYQVLICSPSDVQIERGIIEKAIHSFNALHSFDLKTALLPVRWETHTSPKMGDRPQAIINHQIVEACDILVAAFWTRIGTPTGVAESGSIEEIEEFIAQKKPVLLYFSDAPVALSSVDPNQYQKLNEFKENCKKRGLIESYSEVGGLSDKLHPHLLRTVRELRKESLVPKDTTKSVDAAKGKAPTIKLPTPLALLGLPGFVNMASFNNDLSQYVRKFEIEWSAERDSDPHNTDGGKVILQRFDRKLIDLRAYPCVYEHPEVASSLDEILRTVRNLQRHRLYIDGGKSFREFWEIGNSILEKMKTLVLQVFDMAKESMP